MTEFGHQCAGKHWQQHSLENNGGMIVLNSLCRCDAGFRDLA